MMELPINQYNITEIKYKLSDTKTVTFKLRNFMLKDVEVEETSNGLETSEPIINEDATTIEEKKINDDFDKLKNANKDRCKELMDKLDAVPYKIYEKIGELYTNNNVKNTEGRFVAEPGDILSEPLEEALKNKILNELEDERDSNE